MVLETIKLIDGMVNAVPSYSATAARQLLVERPQDPLDPAPLFNGAISSTLLGYMGGVGAQAAALGGFIGYQTGSSLIGVAVGASGAVVPLGIRITRLGLETIFRNDSHRY